MARAPRPLRAAAPLAWAGSELEGVAAGVLGDSTTGATALVVGTTGATVVASAAVVSTAAAVVLTTTVL
jgi:hypothetical protein